MVLSLNLHFWNIHRLRKKMWWQEVRTRLILGSICGLIVVIMIGTVYCTLYCMNTLVTKCD